MKTPELLSILKGGDLRSDGRANEVASMILDDPSLIPEAVKGLSVSDPVIRGRTADVLEKVARIHYEKFIPYLPLLLEKAVDDDVYMVRFHLAMLLGYLEVSGKERRLIVEALFTLLGDESVFVKSWSIVSLTIIGLNEEEHRESIIDHIEPLLNSDSKAVKRKAENSLAMLHSRKEIPTGWIKKRSHVI